MDSIRIKRGLKAQLPRELPLGELAFCTDTRELYVGMGEGSPLRPVTNTEITEHLAEWKSKYQEVSDQFKTKYDGLEEEYANRLTEISTMLTNSVTLANLNDTPDFDNSPILNDLCRVGGEIQLPANKTFTFKSPIIIDKPTTLIGKNTTLLFECDEGIKVSSSNFRVDNIKLQLKTPNHDKSTCGLFIGKLSGDTYEYTQNHTLENFRVEGFTTSIQMETVYYVELNDVSTFNDKFGFKLNELSKNDTNPTTTLILNRVYFRGTGNSVTPYTDGYGFKLKNVVNLSANTLVSEWYDNCGLISVSQCVTINNGYFEFCKNGVEILTCSGNVTLVDPYINSMTNFGIKWSYASLILIGGRAILTSSTPLFQKEAQSKFYIIKKTSLDGGIFLKNNEFKNSHIVDLTDGIELSDTTNNGVTCVNQGYRNTQYKFGQISTNLNEIPIAIIIGSNNLGSFTPLGLELNPHKSVILRSPNLTQWKITVTDGGDIQASQIPSE